MDIRTWQQADRPDLPEPGFDEDPVVHGAFGPAQPSPDGLGAFGAPGTATAFAADVISLGPAERPGRGARAGHGARHRAGRSPFSPLRPAPIAIGSLSTAAIAAFAFVGPSILHGGDAGSSGPVLDGMPLRITQLTSGPDGSAAGTTATGASPAAAGSSTAPAPSSTATGSSSGPTSGVSTSGGHQSSASPSGPGSPTGPGHPTSSPTGPGSPTSPAPPSRDPSPPSGPPTWQPAPPPGTPVPPPAPPSAPPSQSPPPPTTTPPAPPVFNSAAAVASAITEIDSARTTSGTGALHVDPVLVAAATKHTGDMVKYRTFSHTGSDGSSPYSRAQSVGCWTLSKELIARGRPGDDVVGALLRNWQAGPALLSPLNKSIGVAAQLDPATGDVYWTIELAWL